MAAGLIALSAVGGSRAALAAIAGSIASLGRTVLMFPITALRAIPAALMLLMANPVGIAITAIVTALGALGLWVYNNWSSIQSFLVGFAEGLKGALNPTLVGCVDSLSSGLGSVFNWVSQLLGPIQATNAEWASWGATVGGGVASGINVVADGISRVIGFFSTAIEKAIAFKNALAGAFSSSPTSTAGQTSAGAIAGSVVQARALGGPVRRGETYLVGEEGPELWTPPGNGDIIPNDRLHIYGGGRDENRIIPWNREDPLHTRLDSQVVGSSGDRREPLR